METISFSTYCSSYESTLRSVSEARHLLQEHDIPFLKPKDFLCEMVKDEKQMAKIDNHKVRLEQEKKEKIRNIIKAKKNKPVRIQESIAEEGKHTKRLNHLDNMIGKHLFVSFL